MFHRPIPVEHRNVSFAHEISLEADLPSSCIDGRGCVMGYSMLTRLEGCELRYTEWVRYEGKSAGWPQHLHRTLTLTLNLTLTSNF